MALKFNEDIIASPKIYASIAGLSIDELAILESIFLETINYNLFVKDSLFLECRNYIDELMEQRITEKLNRKHSKNYDNKKSNQDLTFSQEF